MWNPENSELVFSWLSFRELHERGLVILNPWPAADKALAKYDRSEFRDVMGKSRFGTRRYNFVVSNPRAFVTAYNKGMDFMAKEGGCVDPSTFAAVLSEYKNASNDALFSQNQIDEAQQLLRRTIELERSTTS